MKVGELRQPEKYQYLVPTQQKVQVEIGKERFYLNHDGKTILCLPFVFFTRIDLDCTPHITAPDGYHWYSYNCHSHIINEYLGHIKIIGIIEFIEI